MAQSVKGLTLDFGSGHDLTVCGIEPCIRFCAESAEPASDSLSPSLSEPPLHGVCVCVCVCVCVYAHMRVHACFLFQINKFIFQINKLFLFQNK